jgi:hypothetical protein
VSTPALQVARRGSAWPTPSALPVAPSFESAST